METEPECADGVLCPKANNNNNNNTNNNNNNNNNTSNNNNVAVAKKGGSDNGYDAMEMDCGGCGESVRERTVLCVGGRTWHSRCLKCCACARPLHDQHSCFLRGMRLYCRHDYAL